MERAAQRHRGVQRADGGVNHDCGKLAGGFGVAARHTDSDFFVARADIQRYALALRFGFGESFPHRRPFGAGGRKDSVHTHMGKHA